jgi:hypothetical protein
MRQIEGCCPIAQIEPGGDCSKWFVTLDTDWCPSFPAYRYRGFLAESPLMGAGPPFCLHAHIAVVFLPIQNPKRLKGNGSEVVGTSAHPSIARSRVGCACFRARYPPNTTTGGCASSSGVGGASGTTRFTPVGSANAGSEGNPGTTGGIGHGGGIDNASLIAMVFDI